MYSSSARPKLRFTGPVLSSFQLLCPKATTESKYEKKPLMTCKWGSSSHLIMAKIMLWLTTHPELRLSSIHYYQLNFYSPKSTKQKADKSQARVASQYHLMHVSYCPITYVT